MARRLGDVGLTRTQRQLAETQQLEQVTEPTPQISQEQQRQIEEGEAVVQDFQKRQKDVSQQLQGYRADLQRARSGGGGNINNLLRAIHQAEVQQRALAQGIVYARQNVGRISATKIQSQVSSFVGSRVAQVRRGSKIARREPREVSKPSGEVFIDGQGYSVAPELQEQFIAERKATTPISKIELFEEAIKSSIPTTYVAPPVEPTKTLWQKTKEVVPEYHAKFLTTFFPVKPEDVKTPAEIKQEVSIAREKVSELIGKFPAEFTFKTDVSKPSLIPFGIKFKEPVKPIDLFGLDIGGAKPSEIPVSTIKEITGEAIIKKQTELFKETGVVAELEPLYQEKFQTAFEKKYSDKILTGEIEFELAKKKFAESQEAKTIQEKYEKHIKRERAKKGITITEAKIAGLSLLGMGVSLVPTTPLTLGLTALGGVGAYKIMTGLPKITTAYMGYTGIKGIKTALDVEKVGAERVGGIAESVISGAFLGVAGYKYLKSIGASKVAFAGLEQSVVDDLIKTGVLYKTSKGEIGFAAAVSKVKALKGGKFQISLSKVAGAGGKIVYQMPKGFKLKDIKYFLSNQLGVGKPVTIYTKGLGGIVTADEGFLAASIGRTAVKTSLSKVKIQKFLGQTLGKYLPKDITAMLGYTITPSGEITSVGLIKKIPKKPKVFTIEGVESATKTISKQALDTAMASVQDVVRSAVAPPIDIVSPTKIISAGGVVNLARLTKDTQKQSTRLQTDVKQILKQTSGQKMLLSQGVRQKVRTKQRAKLMENVAEKQLQSVLQTQVLKQQPIQKVRQGLRLGQQQVSALRLKALTGFGFTPITPPPAVTPIPFWLPTLKGEKKRRADLKKLVGGKYVYSPDFTAKIAGLKTLNLSMKQTRALLKKELTGFEFRPPVRIKRKKRKTKYKKKKK
ncbi:hypothetical protein ES702_02315 [subsurface metagenome]